MRCQPRLACGSFSLNFPLLMDQSTLSTAVNQEKFQNLRLSIGSQLQPGDKLKDTEGIPSFQRDIKQQDEK